MSFVFNTYKIQGWGWRLRLTSHALCNFPCRHNRIHMNPYGIFNSSRVPARQRRGHWHSPLPRLFKHALVSRLQTVLRQHQATQLILAIGIRAAHVKNNVRPELFERLCHHRQQCLQIFVVLDAVIHIQVHIRRRLVRRIVVQLMNRNCKNRRVVAKNVRRAVSVMHVRVHDHRFVNHFIRLQSPDSHRHVMNRAESLSMVRKCVVKSAAQIASKSVAQRKLARQNRSARRQPHGPRQFRRIRHLQFHNFARRQRSVLQFSDPLPRVHAQQIRVRSFLRQNEIFRRGDLFPQKLQLNQSEFLRRKNVRTKVQIIVGVINNFEGQHDKAVDLVLALENKIRQGQQRSRVLRISLPVDAGLRSRGIFVRKNSRFLQRARFVHQRHQLPRLTVTILHRINQRQRDFSFFQIAQHRLAQLLRRGRKIQQIVHELKRQPGILSIICQRLFLFPFKPAKHGAEPRASAEQTGRFVCRELQRILFRHINPPDFRKLNKFAFDHLLREINQDIEDSEVALFQRHLKRLHVQPVAREHTAMISPARICRRPPAPRVRAVNHVVVNQRGAVQQFDNCRKSDCSFSAPSRITICQQQQCGAHALSPAAQQISRNFRHRLKRRRALPRKLLLHQQQVFAYQLKNLFCRQKGDLFSPGFRCHLSGTPRPWSHAAGQDQRSAENSPQSWLPVLRCSSFSHCPASWPLPRRKQVRFSCRGKALARDTERPFQSKYSQAAKLSQCRANSGLSEKSNFPQRKSGSRYPRLALRLRACSKSNEEFLRAHSAPTLLREFSCNRPTRRGSESRSVSSPPWPAPFAAEKPSPARHAANDRRNNPGRFHPTRSLSDAVPAAQAHPDALASLPSLRADEFQPSYKSSRAALQTEAPHPAFPARALSQSRPVWLLPPPARAPASRRGLPQIARHQYVRASRSSPLEELWLPLCGLRITSVSRRFPRLHRGIRRGRGGLPGQPMRQQSFRSIPHRAIFAAQGSRRRQLFGRSVFPVHNTARCRRKSGESLYQCPR